MHFSVFNCTLNFSSHRLFYQRRWLALLPKYFEQIHLVQHNCSPLFFLQQSEHSVLLSALLKSIYIYIMFVHCTLYMYCKAGKNRILMEDAKINLENKTDETFYVNKFIEIKLMLFYFSFFTWLETRKY